MGILSDHRLKITRVLQGWMMAVSVAAVGEPAKAAAATPALPPYALVVFYQARCVHCQRLAPIVQQYAAAHHWPVLAYHLDGESLPEFPESVTPTREEWQYFFPQAVEHPPQVPSVFWVISRQQRVMPVLQGEATAAQFAARMQDLQAEVSDDETP